MRHTAHMQAGVISTCTNDVSCCALPSAHLHMHALHAAMQQAHGQPDFWQVKAVKSSASATASLRRLATHLADLAGPQSALGDADMLKQLLAAMQTLAANVRYAPTTLFHRLG